MRRILLLVTVIASSISAYLIGTALSPTTDFPFSGPFAIAFPVIGAWLAGLRNPDRLALLGVYALMGWVLGYSLAPKVAGIKGVTLSEYFTCVEWVVASVFAMLLSFVGAAFTPKDNLIPLKKRDYSLAALAIASVGVLLIPSIRYLKSQPAISLAQWIDRTPHHFQYAIDNPPEGIDKDEWKSLVNATAQAVQECFGSPDEITDRPRFHMLCYDIRAKQDMESLAHIWDEIEQISTLGKEYSAKHRPEALSN